MKNEITGVHLTLVKKVEIKCPECDKEIPFDDVFDKVALSSATFPIVRCDCGAKNRYIIECDGNLVLINGGVLNGIKNI